QPASVTLQSGQTLTISCQVTYSLDQRHTHWIRQWEGKGWEWIGADRVGYSSYYKDSLKNQFSISLYSSSKTVTLNGQNMQPDDTGVYYCVYKNLLNLLHVSPTVFFSQNYPLARTSRSTSHFTYLSQCSQLYNKKNTGHKLMLI
uniref:Ig-like domain-containing protein n=1 Tax=Poecilia latipinna TaxID=48699 RepID=A0A3B3UY62_9TELE